MAKVNKKLIILMILVSAIFFVAFGAVFGSLYNNPLNDLAGEAGDIPTLDDFDFPTPTNDMYWDETDEIMTLIDYYSNLAEGSTELPEDVWQGTGTLNDPFLISSAKDLVWLGVICNGGTAKIQTTYFANKYFKQTCNIDLSEFWWEPIGGYNTRVKLSSGGTNVLHHRISGTYDGNGYEISGVYTNSNERTCTHLFKGANATYSTTGFQKTMVGLFGSKTGKEICNLGVVNSYIKGSNYTALNYVGAISGYQGTIKNCYSNASIVGNKRVGGINGNLGILSKCSFSGQVIGLGDYAGGIVAITGDAINSCYNSGNVINYKGAAGGIVGLVGANVNSCYNTGDVTGVNNVGGITAYTGTTAKNINRCYNTGVIKGSGNYVGGISGYGYSNLTNCYNKGVVEGIDSVGGLVGYRATTVTNSYNVGQVVGQTNVGALVGNVNTTMDHCYFGGDCDLEFGLGSSTQETGIKFTQPMAETVKNIKWYLEEDNWNYSSDANIWNFAYWRIDENKNDGFPYLGGNTTWKNSKEIANLISSGIGVNHFSGAGTQTNPYLITNELDFAWLGSGQFSTSGLYFKQTRNLDMSKYAWQIINFYGIYDGDFHSISGIFLASSSNAALFTNVRGYNDAEGNAMPGKILNLTLKDSQIIAQISSSSVSVGGIAASCGNVLIENCINEADVYAMGKAGKVEMKAGGIAGYGESGYSAVLVKNCINKGYIRGEGYRYLGGITGVRVNVENCKNYGEIFSKSLGSVGGIIGYAENSKHILNCENYGKVTSVSVVGGIAGTGGTVTNLKPSGIVENCTNYGKVVGIESSENTPWVGGVVGRAHYIGENLLNCGEVESFGKAGGILCVSYGGNVKLSNYINYGNVKGRLLVGGIVADCPDIEVSNCINYGNLENTSEDASVAAIGGIVGQGKKAINCINYGNITCAIDDLTNFGAILGKSPENVVSTLTNCSSKGSSNVTGLKFSGEDCSVRIDSCFAIINEDKIYSSGTFVDFGLCPGYFQDIPAQKSLFWLANGAPDFEIQYFIDNDFRLLA